MTERRDRVLIVEDDEFFGRQLATLLDRNFLVERATSLDEARSLLERIVFHGVLLDVRLGGPGATDRDGLRLLEEAREQRPLLPVVVMTGYGDVDTAVHAMKLGATDFLEKGSIESPDLIRRLRAAITAVNERLSLEARAAEQIQLAPSNLVGGSASMVPVRESIELAAEDGHCSVLILGETGTGKGMVARAIHAQSWRREAPFVAVPTAGLSGNLLESELFGHEKGAFTGANQSHTGYVERAQGGVLFLDEIGDLAMEVQVKLLRFLEDHVVFKVGSAKGRPVEAQVVAATHRPLRDRIGEGAFRQDLYYRLRTVEIAVPPLRERIDDVPLLADHFLLLLRKEKRTPLTGISTAAIDMLCGYPWPGNVRELKAVTEWAALTAMQRSHTIVESEDFPAEIRDWSRSTTTGDPGAGDGLLDVEVARARAELSCVERALERSDGRKLEAKELLGYSNRQTMRRRIQLLCERYPEMMEDFPGVALAYCDVERPSESEVRR